MKRRAALVAASCGLKGASVGKYLDALSALGLVAGAEAERARLASLGICRGAFKITIRKTLDAKVH